MKLNGKEIILDDDVLMTSEENIGRKLSDVISELQSKTAKTESYLKWIYNYGGVGGTGGGGGASSTEYSIVATLNSIRINNQAISLSGGPGDYTLNIKISRPNGASYRVTYSVNGVTSTVYTLNSENSYETNITVHLTGNSTISVTAVDDVLNLTKTVEARYLTELYKFETSLAYTNNKDQKVGGEVSASDINNNGLSVYVDGTINTSFSGATFTVEFVTPGKTITDTQEITNTENTSAVNVSFDLVKLCKNNGFDLTSDESSGTYTIKISYVISLTDIKPSNTETYTLSIIPKNLYLLVSQPGGANIYKGDSVSVDEKTLKESEKLTTGFVTFTAVPYYGSLSGVNYGCDITWMLGSKEGGDDTSTVQSTTTSLRMPTSLSVNVSKKGWYYIKIRLYYQRGGLYYPSADGWVQYWFYADSISENIGWYTIGTEPRSGVYNYYRGGSSTVTSSTNSEDSGATDSFRPEVNNIFNNSAYYRQTVNKDPVRFYVKNQYTSSVSTSKNLIVNIGLQYSEINSDDNIIFTLYSSTQSLASKSTNSYYDTNCTRKEITVTQNKVTIDTGSSSSNSFSYYFPKTSISDLGSDNNWHLLTLVGRYIRSDSNDKYYEIDLYIDGKLEGAYDRFVVSDFNVGILELGTKASGSSNSVNALYNLLDVSFVYNDNSKPEDILAYNYFLKYSSNMTKKRVDENFLNLLQYGSKFTVKDSDVVCDVETVKNVAAYLNIPTLMFVITDSKDVTDNDSVKKTIDRSYAETADFPSEINPSVYWANPNAKSKEDRTLSKVEFPTTDSFVGASWKLELQGSSTRNYKCKNFDLVLKTDEERGRTNTCLFSPNFNSEDTETFLPEQRFTLKADVVDSSHSNNTSIGRFVNDVTDHFLTGEQDGGAVLKNFTRNCLEGFPVVVFIDYVKPGDLVDTSTTCYYQGIYNFNLGRKSYYNLGYKSYASFYDSTNGAIKIPNSTGNFVFYTVPNTNYKDGLIVAEIQGNSPLYDFSQYDESILFKGAGDNDNSELYMFGDIENSKSITESQVHTIIQNFVKQISRAGGYIFDTLKKSYSYDFDGSANLCGYELSDTSGGYHTVKEMTDKNGNKITVPANRVPNFRVQLKKVLVGGNATYKIADPTEYNGNVGIVNNKPDEAERKKDVVVGSNDLKEAILGFSTGNGDVKDQDAWIDFKSLSEYYTICMAFGLVDSVQKNMNIKTWTANTKSGIAKFYAAFYDMDTSLGLSNSGGDVGYSAFSDYWRYNENVQGNIVTPNYVVIYNDYSPKSDSDFDTPSSYLFALAKYAKFIYPNDSNIDTSWPAYLWYEWRKPGGKLESAKVFMDKYFSNNVGSACPLFVSLNYRNKYFIESKNEATGNVVGYDSANFPKFHGTRIYKATDWLNSRFHILDAYFNVPGVNSPIFYYNDNGDYVEMTDSNSNKVYYPALPENLVSQLAKNTDIKILQDIFSPGTNAANVSTTNVDVNVTARNNSPMVIRSSNNVSRYLLSDSSKTYHLTLPIAGNQQYYLYGSGEWLTIDSITNFGFSNLYVNSNYLETLSGANTNKSMKLTSANIVMPSLRTLSLNSSLYTGTFTNTSDTSTDSTDRFTNLDTIDFSSSNISITLNNSPVRNVNIGNIKGVTANGNTTYPSVILTNCSDLQKVDFGTGNPSTSLETLRIDPVPFVNNSSNITLNNTRIKNIVLYNNTATTDWNSDNPKPNSSVTIANDNYVTNISVGGFSKVTITGCPNLETITIRRDDDDNAKGDKLTTIYLSLAGAGINASALVNLNSSSDSKTIDLHTFNYLDHITLRSCYSIEQIILPKNNKRKYIDRYGFANDYALKTLDGDSLALTGPGTFNHCPNYTLKDSTGAYNQFSVQTTDLSYTFCLYDSWHGESNKITTEAVRSLLNNGGFTFDENKGKVTNIDHIFCGQRGITYTQRDMATDLANNASKESALYPDMTVFKYVTNATYALFGTGINALHHGITSIGSEAIGTSRSATITMTGYVTSATSSTYYLEPNTFKDIIDVIPIIGNGETGTTFAFCDSNGAIINGYVNATKYFNFESESRYPKKLQSLMQVNFTTTQTLDFGSWKNTTSNREVPTINTSDSFFNANWSSFTTLYNSINAGNTNFINTDCLLYRLPKLSSIQSSLNFNTNRTSSPVDIYHFINWGTAFNNNLSISVIDWGNISSDDSKDNNFETACFSFKSYITSSDWSTFWNVVANYKMTSLAHIFKNCSVLVANDSSYVLKIGNGVENSGSSVTNMNELFYGLDIINFTNISGWDDSTILLSTLKNTITAIEADGSNDIVAASDTTYSANKIPIVLNDKFFASFQKVKTFQFTFANTNLGTSIPLDFFCKRQPVITKEIYYSEEYSNISNSENSYIYKVGDGDEDATVKAKFSSARLTNYTYNREITDMRGIFKNVKWESGCRYFNYTKVSDGFRPKLEVLDSDGNVTKTIYTPGVVTFKTNSGLNAKGETIYFFAKNSATINECTEITDIEELNDIDLNHLDGFIGQVTIQTGNDTINVDNIVIDEIENYKNKMFIAPDIFYGCSQSANDSIIRQAFSNDKDYETDCLGGYIPSHLMKNVMTKTFRNTFRNLNIVPRWYRDDVYYGANGIKTTRKVYIFVPDKFTNVTSFSNNTGSFNFRLRVPGRQMSTASTIDFSAFYMFLQGSIPKSTTLMDDAIFISSNNSSSILYSKLISGSNNSNINTGIKNSYSTDFGVHCNLMYNPGSYNKTYTIEEDGYTLTVKKNYDATGELIGTDCKRSDNGDLTDSDKSIAREADRRTDSELIGAECTSTEGISSSYFNSMAFDRLVPKILSYFYYGNLFDQTLKLDNLRWSNTSNYIIDTYYYSTYTGYTDGRNIISRNMMLPEPLSTGSDYSSTTTRTNIKLFRYDTGGSEKQFQIMYDQIIGNDSNNKYKTSYETIFWNNSSRRVSVTK